MRSSWGNVRERVALQGHVRARFAIYIAYIRARLLYSRRIRRARLRYVAESAVGTDLTLNSDSSRHFLLRLIEQVRACGATPRCSSSHFPVISATLFLLLSIVFRSCSSTFLLRRRVLNLSDTSRISRAENAIIEIESSFGQSVDRCALTAISASLFPFVVKN